MSRFTRSRTLVALTAAAALLLLGAVDGAHPASAAADSTVVVPAQPGSSPVVTWTDTAPFYNGQEGLLIDDPLGGCDPSDHTHNVQHTVQLTFPDNIDPSYDTLVRFTVSWTDGPGGNTLDDLALRLFGPDHKLIADSDGSQPLEGINVTDRVSGVYTVLVCSFQNLPVGTPFTGKVTAQTTAQPSFPAAGGVTAPSYRQYTAPKGLSTNAGEPSIGNSWKSGNTLFTSNTDLFKVEFDDAKGTSKWSLVNDYNLDPSNKISLDPIGFTDHVTGRTFMSQLYFVCSGSAFSDDDFATQPLPSEGCGTGLNGFDHQTLGGGPYPAGAVAVPVGYPHAVYYCSQSQGLLLGGATCARSDNGGVTYGPPIQTWTTACSGIHGHVQVAPDGTVYVPNAICGDHQGLAVSTDAGLTWAVHTIPDSIAGQSDPAIGIGSSGTVYEAYSDGTGQPRVAISHDRGATWGKSIDIGRPLNLHNSEFAEAVAGDDDRAAVAFLGTPTRGSTQAASFGKKDGTFTGAEWHMYVSTTYDGGATWTTVDSTPTDPVQRGCIWNAGGGNPCRNLLDFNGMTIDKTGRVMIGFADGCVPPEIDSARGNDCVASKEVSANGLVNHGAIVRQVSGKTLFRAYDVAGSSNPVVLPPTKPASGKGNGNGGHLAATGGAPALALLGLVALTLGFAAHRRRRA